MSTLSYNPILISKLLDRAGHPNTYDTEALASVRKAADLLGKADKTLGDAVIVESGMFFHANTMPSRNYHAEIADLTLGLEKSRTEMTEVRAASDAKIAELAEELARSHAETRKALAAVAALTAALELERTAASSRDIERDTQLAAIEADSAAIREQLHNVAADMSAGTAVASSSPEVDDLFKGTKGRETVRDRALKWTRRVLNRFHACVDIGMSARKVVSMLSSEFRRKVTLAEVTKRMGDRWQPDTDGFYRLVR